MLLLPTPAGNSARHKSRDMARLLLVFLLLLFLTGMVKVNSQPTVNSPETKVVGGPEFVSPAPNDIIKKAENYVMALLGESYFESHFTFKNTFKVTDYSYAFGVEFWYEIPHEADISAKTVLLTFD